MQVKDITSNSLVYCSLLANYDGGNHLFNTTTYLFTSVSGTLKNINVQSSNSTAIAGVVGALSGTIDNAVFSGILNNSGYESFSTGGLVAEVAGDSTIKIQATMHQYLGTDVLEVLLVMG